MATSAVLAITILMLCLSTCVETKSHMLLDSSRILDTDSPTDIEYNTKIYKEFLHDEEALTTLKNIVRTQLRTKNSQLLANNLCAGGSPAIKQRIKGQVDMFLADYDAQLIKDIVHDAIQIAYACGGGPLQLVDLLWSLYQEDNLASLELTLYSQMELFHVHAGRQHHEDKKFQRKFAFTLYKIKRAKLYKSVAESLKQQLDNLVTPLPTNLQYLLFYPYFCLMHSKYSEYIYTAITKGNLDSTSRYVWVWHEKLSIDDSGHIKANIFESNGGTSDFLVQLKGTTYGVFYYMRPQTNLIAAWDLPSEPVNYIWNIELIDNDRVALYQGDYIMCSTDVKHDDDRREVKGYKRGSYSTKSSECQWLMGTCNRNT